MDQPTQIGTPNNSSPANTHAGSYDNERSESGGSVASGRGSVSNDCTVKSDPEMAEFNREAAAGLKRQGK